mgnify:CR=1 FL=1
MAEKFQRHRQPWTSDEVQKLHLLAGKGMSLRAISKAMTRSEESIQALACIFGGCDNFDPAHGGLIDGECGLRHAGFT